MFDNAPSSHSSVLRGRLCNDAHQHVAPAQYAGTAFQGRWTHSALPGLSFCTHMRGEMNGFFRSTLLMFPLPLPVAPAYHCSGRHYYSAHCAGEFVHISPLVLGCRLHHRKLLSQLLLLDLEILDYLRPWGEIQHGSLLVEYLPTCRSHTRRADKAT